MFDGVYFEFPKIIFVFFFFVACEAMCKLRLPGIYFPHIAGFAAANIKPSLLHWFLKWLAITLLITALMSPVRDAALELDESPGYEIALVIDASQSMQSGGFDSEEKTRSRFDAVQEIINRFIDERRSDAIGLVVFGKYAFVASPLTTDLPILEGIVDQLYIGMAGKFTALYEAVAQGVNLLRGGTGKNRIAIILTDGHNTPGGRVPADVAVALAKKEGVKLYTIGIGKPDDYNGAVLEQIARATGGKSFGAEESRELSAVYEAIDALEKSPLRPPPITFKKYYYVYPLFAGFMALLLYVYLRNRRRSA